MAVILDDESVDGAYAAYRANPTKVTWRQYQAAGRAAVTRAGRGNYELRFLNCELEKATGETSPWKAEKF